MAEMERDPNLLGAIARGTSDGLHLALNVGAMLISFIALMYLVDACFGGMHNFLAAHGSGVVSVEPRADFRLGVRAGGVGHRRSVA